MQNKFWISQSSGSSPARLSSWVRSLIPFLCLLLLWPAVLRAQSTPPTPVPLAPEDTLVAVAGGHGADLWDAEGSEPTQHIEPGARLVASKRSSDSQWLYVTTAAGVSGWAAADQLIVFYRLQLPTEAVNITPATPTPQPTATPADSPASSTATETVVAESVPVAATGVSTTTVSALPADGATLTARVLSDARLNIRSGPGTEYGVIAKAQPAQALTVIGRTEDRSWVEVQTSDAPSGSGWVAAQYLAFGGVLADVAVSTRVSSPPAAETNNLDSAATTDASPTTLAVTTPATGLAGKLVFQTSFGGQIYLYELGSGQPRQLTTGFDPALSPDGRQVVFTRGGGDNGVYLINSDGSNEHKIFGERELLRSPKWSPDGQWILFVRGDEFEDCRIYDEDGICYPESRFPAPNPRSYPRGKNPIPKLARIDPNGDNYRDLATMERAEAPDWNSAGVVYQSVTGLQITADQPEAVNRELYFEIRKQYHQDPDWQPGPEGTPGRIVFQQRQGSHWEIFAINADGGGLTALTRPATALVDAMPSNVAPAWSPDGRHIVFLSNRTESNEAGAWRLWVMDADGSNQHPLPVNLPFEYTYVVEQMVDWGP